MTRNPADLPRDWLLVNFEMARAAQNKEFIAQAVEWGFDEPPGLTNQAKRVRFLRKCREKALDMLASGNISQAPGKAQPADAPRKKPRPKRPSTPRPAKPKAAARPQSEEPSQVDYFPPKRGNRQGKAPSRPVVADLCTLPASEVNAFLRSLPTDENS
jgi:hypothetical protein